MSKIIVGVYNDEDSLKSAVKHIREKKVKIANVYTPYPVHGLDDCMGLSRSKLPVFSFWVGFSGFIGATLMQVGIHSYTWPLNLMNPMVIGGKPHGLAGIPAFVPIMFEVMVLSSALSIVGGFLFRSKLYPSLKAEVIDPRATDDKLIITINMDDVPIDSQAVNQLFNETSPAEIYEKEVGK
jgi:hypothetical protein